MDKKTIKIQYKWSYLQYLMLAFMMIFLLLLPSWAFEKGNDPTWLKILWYGFFSLATVIFLIGITVYYQTAELDSNLIKIKCLLFSIKKIKWEELKMVRVERLASGSAGMSIIYKEWIVLYTDLSQTRYHGGINKKKKGPWYIVKTDENLQILKQYTEKYCKNIYISEQ